MFMSMSMSVSMCVHAMTMPMFMWLPDLQLVVGAVHLCGEESLKVRVATPHGQHANRQLPRLHQRRLLRVHLRLVDHRAAVRKLEGRQRSFGCARWALD